MRLGHLEVGLPGLPVFSKPPYARAYKKVYKFRVTPVTQRFTLPSVMVASTDNMIGEKNVFA